MEQKKNNRKLKLKYDKDLKDIDNDYYKVANIYLNIRLSLQFLYQVTQCVNINQQQQLSSGGGGGNTSNTPSVPIETVKYKDKSTAVVIDVDQILIILKERYQLLINNFIDLDTQQNLSAVALYQQALMDASNQAHHNDFDQVIDHTCMFYLSVSLSFFYKLRCMSLYLNFPPKLCTVNQTNSLCMCGSGNSLN